MRLTAQSVAFRALQSTTASYGISFHKYRQDYPSWNYNPVHTTSLTFQTEWFPGLSLSWKVPSEAKLKLNLNGHLSWRLHTSSGCTVYPAIQQEHLSSKCARFLLTIVNLFLSTELCTLHETGRKNLSKNKAILTHPPTPPKFTLVTSLWTTGRYTINQACQKRSLSST